MDVVVREEPSSCLDAYARVSIAFEVRRVVEAVRDGPRYVLVERAVDTPWTKDYDALPGNRPLDWPRRFDVSRWGFFLARHGGEPVGGAVLAYRTPGLDDLAGRDDLAVLFDLRVAPRWRRRGVGSRLLEAAVAWARVRSCVDLDVETQNVNVGACRFYERHGFALRTVEPRAYPTIPRETRLVWRRHLERAARGPR